MASDMELLETTLKPQKDGNFKILLYKTYKNKSSYKKFHYNYIITLSILYKKKLIMKFNFIVFVLSAKRV